MPPLFQPVMRKTFSPGGIPVELWLMVMKLLPKKSVRSCLHVCRIWHDIALTLLFSTVKLHFMGPDLAFYGDFSRQKQINAMPLTDRTWEILDHIPSNSTFARTIKFIIVYASDYNLCFEKLSLIKALRCMPYLVGFEWIANSSSHIQDIQETLLVSCPRLQRLRYPLDITPPPLKPFPQKITSLNLTPADMWEKDDNAVWYLIDVFPSAMDTLTTLVLACVSMRDIPTEAYGIFAHLKELTFWEPYEIDALLLPLRHERALEFLALKSVDGGENLCTFLQGATTLLPRLSTFLLASDEYIGINDLSAVRNFLIGHPGLERLHLRIYCPSQFIPTPYPALARLHSLQALWLDTGPAEMIDIRPLISVLPRSLRVLVLYVRHDCFAELLRCLSGFPHLTALCLPYEHPLSPHILTVELKRLTFVAAGKSVVRVERDSSGSKVELRRVPFLELATWHRSDFDDPNMSWMAEDLKSWLTSAKWKVLH